MKITAPYKIKDSSVSVPTSKSISNRLLIIQSLCGGGEIVDLSDAEDTTTLARVLKELPSRIDVGHAGTAFRFLTAYLSITSGEYILTGSDRMKNRPVGVLVEALRELGANIQYLDKEGYPPLKIVGSQMQGGQVSIKSDVSSQFISALMLIAPYLEKGLKIKLIGEVVSQPYIKMTQSLMESCGVDLVFNNQEISIPNGNYKFESLNVEKDWSAISFWYEMVLIGEIDHLLIEEVFLDSIQGDSYVLSLFKNFGVQSTFDDQGVHLSFIRPNRNDLPRIVDFKNTPDLIQPFVVSIAAINEQYVISGSKNLAYKETDRAAALKMELAKCGAFIDVAEDSILVLKGIDNFKKVPEIKTHQDHRMAMAFAPLALLFENVEIENPDVVKKSYPTFWGELEKLGFTLL